MFDYPVFEMPTIGLRMLMAIDAITHVYVSHGGAVGGSIVLVIAAYVAHKRNDMKLYELVRRILMVFFIATTAWGALTGIGIWIHANIINPNGIGSLIRVFFWKWFIEWIVFNLEVIFLLAWFMSWKKNAGTAEGRVKSLRLGLIYAANSWVTMLIITAILGFMLTPEFEGQPWIDPEVFPSTVNYNNALFNPTWFPGLFMRTFMAIGFGAGLAIYWAWIFTHFDSKKDPEVLELRARAIRLFGVIMTIAAPLGALVGIFYLAKIPKEAADMIPVAMLTRAFAADIWLVYGIVVGVGVLLIIGSVASLLMPKRMPYGVAALSILAFVVFWGFEERVREFIRKPYIIYNYMYANGIRVTDVPYLNKVGILKHAVFIDEDKKILKADKSNIIDVGHSVFRIECRACHTEYGVNSLAGNTKGWSKEAIHARVGNLRSGTTLFMPPFTGTEQEKEALVEYIYSLNQPGVIK
jgi:hypothetical protein